MTKLLLRFSNQPVAGIDGQRSRESSCRDEPSELRALVASCFYKSVARRWLIVSLAVGTSLLGCKSEKPRRGAVQQAGEQPRGGERADNSETDRAPMRRATRRDLQGPTTIVGNQPLLNRFDDNGNGKLDPNEIEEMKKTRVANVLKRLDLNGDGLVSRLEAQNAKGKLTRVLDSWDELDTDKSDSLSIDELTAALERGPKRAPPTLTTPKETVPRQENKGEPSAR